MMSGDAFQEMAVRTEKEEMLAGLMSDQKYLPCKFFYDETGSRLYEQITRLEEYYPSRTEKSILKRHAEELMRDTDAVSLVDIGSGDCSKISILLHVLPKSVLSEITYVPVDVSMSAMEESRYKLQLRFGAIDVCGIIADFTKEIHLVSQHDNRIFCFFGSTIGNLDTREARSLVAKLGKLMKPGERLLLGLDMVKDKRILERAYNDKDKVTSEFNKNILKVANRILGTNFDLRYFQHHAFYNDEEERVE
ncbi:MAG: L-histidine N(alpha)-methyltransferase, partial [Thermodesulfobacteriota bacterium]|nr:L-histidine N(alpha)-methyltransferase [Thermodesulfobacteriota bacterium]